MMYVDAYIHTMSETQKSIAITGEAGI